MFSPGLLRTNEEKGVPRATYTAQVSNSEKKLSAKQHGANS